MEPYHKFLKRMQCRLAGRHPWPQEKAISAGSYWWCGNCGAVGRYATVAAG